MKTSAARWVLTDHPGLSTQVSVLVCWGDVLGEQMSRPVGRQGWC